jgi:uncharacterized protein YndB with AHSA1/START domain
MLSSPIVETQMLIRKPAELVFNAFIEPEQTKNFWFTHSSGRLEEGKTVLWQWEMYGAEDNVDVIEIIYHKKITIRWSQPRTTVDFLFEPAGEHTLVIIKNYNLQGKGSELIETIKDLTAGFTTVLDGLKAWLEHGINLNLIGDKFPQAFKK